MVKKIYMVETILYNGGYTPLVFKEEFFSLKDAFSFYKEEQKKLECFFAGYWWGPRRPQPRFEFIPEQQVKHGSNSAALTPPCKEKEDVFADEDFLF